MEVPGLWVLMKKRKPLCLFQKKMKSYRRCEENINLIFQIICQTVFLFKF